MLPNAFTYEAETIAVIDGGAGGVSTQTNGVMLTVPPLGITGMVVVTLTPCIPPTEATGSLLLYSFSLNVSVDGQPVVTETNPLLFEVDVAGSLGAANAHLRPFESDESRVGSLGGANEQPHLFERNESGGWTLVRTQSYSRGTQRLSARVARSAEYVVSMSSASRIMAPAVTVNEGVWQEFPW